MTDAYRDDLEAALARASDLEREVGRLRDRIAALESGDRQVEARENARRLEAALEREREELLLHHQQDVELEGRAQAARILGMTAYPPAPPPADPYVLHRRAAGAISIIAAAATALTTAKTDSVLLAMCFVVLVVLGVLLVTVDAAGAGDRARRAR